MLYNSGVIVLAIIFQIILALRTQPNLLILFPTLNCTPLSLTAMKNSKLLPGHTHVLQYSLKTLSSAEVPKEFWEGRSLLSKMSAGTRAQQLLISCTCTHFAQRKNSQKLPWNHCGGKGPEKSSGHLQLCNVCIKC